MRSCSSSFGTYAYFKGEALFGGDHRYTVKEQPGSSAVVQTVAADKYGIGYSAVGYKTADVRTVPLAAKEGKCFEATSDNAYSGEYPLARFLYIYFNKKPGQPLDPLMSEFIKYVLSKEGQQVVIKNGFYPVSKTLAEEDLKQVATK